MRSSQSPYAHLNRVLQIVVLAYQALAVGAFVFALIFGLRWMRLPFLGALL